MKECRSRNDDGPSEQRQRPGGARLCWCRRGSGRRLLGASLEVRPAGGGGVGRLVCQVERAGKGEVGGQKEVTGVERAGGKETERSQRSERFVGLIESALQSRRRVAGGRGGAAPRGAGGGGARRRGRGR